MAKRISGKAKLNPKLETNLNEITQQLNSGQILTANYNSLISEDVDSIPIVDVEDEDAVDNIVINKNIQQVEQVVEEITKNAERVPVYNYSMDKTGNCKIEAIRNTSCNDHVKIDNPIKVESESYIEVVKQLIVETTERIRRIQIERKVCEVLMRSNDNYEINNNKYIMYSNDLKEQQSRLSALKSLLMG